MAYLKIADRVVRIQQFHCDFSTGSHCLSKTESPQISPPFLRGRIFGIRNVLNTEYRDTDELLVRRRRRAIALKLLRGPPSRLIFVFHRPSDCGRRVDRSDNFNAIARQFHLEDESQGLLRSTKNNKGAGGCSSPLAEEIVFLFHGISS